MPKATRPAARVSFPSVLKKGSLRTLAKMPNARVVQREKPTPTGFAPAIPTPSAVVDGLASTSLSASSVEVVARGIEPTHTESCDSTLPSGTSTTKGAGRGERGYFRRQIYNPDFHNPADEIIPKFVNFWKNLRNLTFHMNLRGKFA